MLSLLSDADGLLRRSDLPSLAFEVLLLKLAELPRLVPIEDLLSGKSPIGPLAQSTSTYSGAAEAPSSASKGTQKEKEREKEKDSGSPARSAAPSAPPPAAAKAGSSKKTAEEERPRFVGLTPLEIEPEPLATPDPGGAFRAEVERRHSTLGAVLEDASIRIEGRVVHVILDPPSTPMETRLAEPAMKKVLDEAAVTLLGKSAQVVVDSAMPAGGDLTAAAAAADPAALEKENLKKRVAADEKVRKMLDLFGGEIADVKHDRRDG
jgi:hypothetical protein